MSCVSLIQRKMILKSGAIPMQNEAEKPRQQLPRTMLGYDTKHERRQHGEYRTGQRVLEIGEWG